MISQVQYFDIKYPFTNNDIEKYELDLNKTEDERVVSDMLHVIFTPKGERLRHPDFGTNLTSFIFDPSDSRTWDGVKKEVMDAVSMWVSGVVVNDINVMATEDGVEIYVRIDYSVIEGNLERKNSVAIKL